MRPPAPFTFVFLLALAACGDDPIVPGDEPGISFPVGTNVSDTIGATPVQAVAVQVRGGDGGVAANEVVRVEAIRDSSVYHEMLAASLGSNLFESFLADTTDEKGMVHFRVRMGRRAGPARLVVTVPALGLQDTARFEILPGAPASFQGIPIDKGIPIGGTLSLDIGVADRHGNPRTDPVTYSGASAAGSVAGNVVTGKAFGNVTVVVTAGSLSTEAVIPVVPVASVAFNIYSAGSYGDTSAVYTANLDGSDARRVATSVAPLSAFGWRTSAWLSSTRLIYSDGALDYPRSLYVLDLTTGESTHLLPPEQQMEMQQQPSVSHDGSWIFFSGGTRWDYSIYRVRANGEDLQRISPEGAGHLTPAPAPDGTKVAYAAGAWERGFEIIDLATEEVRHIPVRGDHPRWSPDGNQIAYVSSDSNLRLINPDGMGDRSLAQAIFFVGGIDWSPDGAYIMGTDGTRLIIVETATGELVTVSVPGLGDGVMVSPVWRPETP